MTNMDSFCKRAKLLLDSAGIEYKAVELDETREYYSRSYYNIGF